MDACIAQEIYFQLSFKKERKNHLESNWECLSLLHSCAERGRREVHSPRQTAVRAKAPGCDQSPHQPKQQHLLSSGSGGHKPNRGIDGLKPRCQQGCFPLETLRENPFPCLSRRCTPWLGAPSYTLTGYHQPLPVVTFPLSGPPTSL